MAKIQNFVIGLQARDKMIGGGIDQGNPVFTKDLVSGNSTTNWAKDSTCYRR